MTMQTAQARAAGQGQLYLDFTVTDAPYGNPRFLIGGSRFYSTNAAGGAPVCPVVRSWGSFQGGISGGISEEGGGRIVLDANAKLIPSNGTTRMSVAQWLREIQFREAEASLYQWNATESSQELVWKGYIIGDTHARFVDGVDEIEITLVATTRDFEQAYVSDLITKSAFSAAPLGSLGKMVPRVYGNANELLSSTDVGAGLARIGLPLSGIRGVIVDESQATAKVKVRFAKNDGASSWSSFPTGTADDAGSYGGLWIRDPSIGYGMVDAGSYTVTNDTDKLEVIVDAAPKVFFFLRPKRIGSTNAAGFTDSHKIIDSDTTNFVVSDAGGNHSWAFYLPSVNLPGRVKSIGMVADWLNAHATKNRQISLGIWDVYRAGGANWLHGGLRLKTVTKLAGDPRIITMQDTAAFRYEQSNFKDHDGNDTHEAFAGGQFITLDTGDANQATLELRVFVEDLGGAHSGRDGVRLYNVGIVVEVDYTPTPRDIEPYRLRVSPFGAIQWDMPAYYAEAERLQSIELADQLAQARQAILGVDFFARGNTQKDNGSGHYTGSASAVIREPHDIVHHLLESVSGQTVNDSASTLGNFVDPRTNGVTKDMNLLLPIGPEPTSKKAAVERITKRFPLRVRRKAGTWHCFPDDMNPHSSRVYRSTSEVIEIGPNDIALDTFVDRPLDISEIVNSVQLNYSHGYPDREAGAQTTYENHLSQKWFGKKATTPFDYPELLQSDMSAAVDAGPTALAEWLGRRSARPRRLVSCSLFQKFYDLEPGHCLGFKDLERVGITSKAYRAGLLDYYFNTNAGGTDYADSSAVVFINAASSVAAIGLSQQTDRLTFGVATAAAYTSIANQWRYSISGGTANFANVQNTDVLKSTGTGTVSWDRPNWWEWIKTTQTLGGTVYGPCYWIFFNYGTVTNAGLGNARITYPALYKGRYFEVLNATRTPGRRSKDYPYKDVLMMEVM